VARQVDRTLERLSEVVERALMQDGFELVLVEFKPEGGVWILRVLIDKPGGVTLDDCAAVSSRLSLLLDVEDLISRKYTLEVSSPGLDRPLTKRDHFERFANKLVRIKLKPECSGRKKFRGRLAGLEGDCVVVHDESESRSYSLELADILSARLEVEL